MVEDPGEREAPPGRIIRQLRGWIRDDGCQGVARTMRETELELPKGSHAKDMPDLMPDPARIGSKAERFGAVLPLRSCPRRQIADRKVDFKGWALDGVLQVDLVAGPAFRADLPVDRSPAFSHPRADARPIEGFEGE